MKVGPKTNRNESVLETGSNEIYMAGIFGFAQSISTQGECHGRYFFWEINETPIPFLDLRLSITENKITTSSHYKPTNTHNYLHYKSSHPPPCKNAIPYSQFVRLRRICSDQEDYNTKSNEMASYFKARGYPSEIVAACQTKIAWMLGKCWKQKYKLCRK